MSKIPLPYYNEDRNFPFEHMLNDWLKEANNQTKVSMLSIPGSHDSGTYSAGNKCCQFAFSSQCQVWSVYDQLRLGIRFLDLRVKMQKDEPYLKHGSIKFDSFQVVADQLAQFLRENPSEFIILSFQGDVPDTKTTILAILTKLKVEYTTAGHIPTVGQIRGKVWIMGGFGVRFEGARELLGIHGVQDTNDLFCQNNFSLDSDFTMSNKVQSVISTAFRIPSVPTRLKVNYLSASGPGNVKGFLFGPYPYKIAKDKEGPNVHLLAEIEKQPKTILGLVIVDYPGNQLIRAVVKSNDFCQ